MNLFDKVEDPRRRILVESLAAGFVAAAAPVHSAYAAWNPFGKKPEKLPPERSIYRIVGNVTVNGTAATMETIIFPGDIVVTGPSSEIVFVVGGHAMILRSDTRLEIEGEKKSTSRIIAGLRLVAGKILSVSRNAKMPVRTAVATIGIRGTGWYAESDPEQTYFCTCYGTTDIAASHDPDQSKTTIVATRHDRPIYILGDAEPGKGIRDAPFFNHTDEELVLIETLVGRTPPFVFPKDDYSGPRRDY